MKTSSIFSIEGRLLKFLLIKENNLEVKGQRSCIFRLSLLSLSLPPRTHTHTHTFMLLGIEFELRTLCMLGKYSTTELHPEPPGLFGLVIDRVSLCIPGWP